ncbi:hypothetical protein D5086_030624 [Populus alba]|uniref:Uncharacterized protein n=1 Tax=Populus alba TaxID=43335 RepID=A0ACC4ANZ7_POPAL
MDGASVISFPEGPILPIQSQEEGFCLVAKAMAKFVAVFLLALIAISMLQTLVVASHGRGGHHKNRNVHHNARGGAARPSTISHACSSARSAAGSASAFPQAVAPAGKVDLCCRRSVAQEVSP